MVQPEGRLTELETSGSPTISTKNASQIAASGVWSYEIEGTSSHKWLPFDSITVNNTSARDIQIDIGAHQLIVPANSVRTKDSIAYTNVRVTNLDASNTIAANEIQLSMWKEPISENELLRKEKGRRFGLGIINPFRFPKVLTRGW